MLALGLAVCLADVASFCSQGPPGHYCSDNLSGFYWCLPNPAQSAYFACPATTVCRCFIGPACENVPTVGTGSPCGYPTITPSFATSYTASQTITGHNSYPVSSEIVTGAATIYLSGTLHKERIDTFLATTDSSSGTTRTTSTREYYTLNANGTYSHFTFDVIASSCSGEIVTTLPNTGVPNGFQIYNSTALDTTYYSLSGYKQPIEIYGTTETVRVAKNTNVPLSSSKIINSFRVTYNTFNTFASYHVGEPISSAFTIPAVCL